MWGAFSCHRKREVDSGTSGSNLMITPVSKLWIGGKWLQMEEWGRMLKLGINLVLFHWGLLPMIFEWVTLFWESYVHESERERESIQMVIVYGELHLGQITSPLHGTHTISQDNLDSVIAFNACFWLVGRITFMTNLFPQCHWQRGIWLDPGPRLLLREGHQQGGAPGAGGRCLPPLHAHCS